MIKLYLQKREQDTVVFTTSDDKFLEIPLPGSQKIYKNCYLYTLAFKEKLSKDQQKMEIIVKGTGPQAVINAKLSDSLVITATRN